MTDALHIYLIAGESSGDYLGSRLMQALKNENPGVKFSGVGGTLMKEAGLDSLFPMSDLSVMGLIEILPRIPHLLGRIKQTVRHIRDQQPDILITIDSPDFCFRVAKLLKQPRTRTLVQDIGAYASGKEEAEAAAKVSRMFHYVAPTVWAWRPERAKKVAALYDGILCLFPFEPPWFEAEGMRASFIGHPVMESGYDKADGKAMRRDLAIPDNAKVLGVLFGSRMGELNRTGPALREAAYRYVQENPDTHILTLTLPHLEREVRNLLQGFLGKTHVVTDQTQKWKCFAAMHAALATSGTVGLELAVAGVPHVIAYKMNPLTAQIVRRKVTVRHAHLVNIFFEDEAVPEFIQGNCVATKIHEGLKVLMNDDIARLRQKMIFEKFREHITAPSGGSSSQLAARFVLQDRPSSPALSLKGKG